MALDLDAYLARIFWRGPLATNHATLAGLLAAHVAHIPWENLDPLLGRPVRLDVDGLQHKMVRGRRGGYCFEHASLFAAVLEAVGFAPVRHAARVVVFLPFEQSPRGHMFLTVAVAGTRYVVDPGFGPFGAAFPVPLTAMPPEAAAAPPPTHWMAREGHHWVLHATRDGQSFPGWLTTLETENPVDFEVASHWIGTHPNSLFTQRLMASAVTPEGRVSIMNRDVTIRRGGEVASHVLPDRAALRRLLAEHFGFDLPEAERLRVPSLPEWT